MTDKEQPQMSESDRIRERKKKVIETLTTKFNEEVWRDRLLKICGGDESRIMKAVNSFLAYIMADEGGNKDQKSYIADCTMASISAAFLEAFQMGIEVGGGRDHAYLVNYANNCELDISYKGFVYALNKHFDNAFVDARCVFEGDKFDCEITDRTATYTHRPVDPFAQTWDKLKGCFCYFSYTLRDGGGQVSRLIMIPRGADARSPDSLEMIRSKSKGSWAWKDFPFEQCKKSTMRRAAKIPFASIEFGDEDTNPETVDNRHYDLEGGNSSNRLRLMMDKHKEMMQNEKPDEPKKVGSTRASQSESDDQVEQPTATAIPAGEGGKTSPDSPASPPMVLQEEIHEINDDDKPAHKEISDADFSDISSDEKKDDPKAVP